MTDPSSPPVARWRDRLARVARLRRPPPRVRGALLLVAGIGVAVGLALSIRALEVGWADLRWRPLAVAAVVLTPLTIVLNGAELKVMSRVVAREEQRLSWPEALRTTVAATAANLLPLPGGALVRIAAVRGVGAGTGSATVVNAVGAGIWVAAGLLIAAVAATTFAPAAAVWAAAMVGLLGVGAGLTVLYRLARPGDRAPTAAGLVGVEAATALVHGLRLWLVLLALGADVVLRQALALGAGAPLAAAAGVFPSGLGLAEALTALIAPLVALPAAAGFAATALGRIVGLAVTSPVALVFAFEDLRDARDARRDQASARNADPRQP